LFYFGHFLRITDVAQFLGYVFPLYELCIRLDKNGLGYILGDFVINSSGHPAWMDGVMTKFGWKTFFIHLLLFIDAEGSAG
jgi:hypothetical protein